MTSRKVVLATRGSALARWQSEWVADRLRAAHPGLAVEPLVVSTTGDEFQAASLQVLGGKGAFTKEIQDALLDRRADLAVHSLKDLPTEPVPGLRVWAHPPRFDARDAWLGRDGLRLADLPARAEVATGSLRRMAQLRNRHPSARVVPIRGNLDTRLRKFHEGTMAGMFLAMAGLERLGLLAEVTEALPAALFLPAPGQGALAVEGRDDDATGALLSPLDDPATTRAVTAERAFLGALGAGCQVPLGAWAADDAGELRLLAMIGNLEGTVALRGDKRGAPARPAELGRALAEDFAARGAGDLIEAARRGAV